MSVDEEAENGEPVVHGTFEKRRQNVALDQVVVKVKKVAIHIKNAPKIVNL